MRAAIADVCDINPRLGQKPADDEPVAFIGMADLDEIEAVATDPEVRPYAEVAKGYTPFVDGDLLVAKITPCFQNSKIGQARTSTRLAFGSTEFHVLRPHGGVANARYLLHMLRHQDVLRHGEMRMTGAGGQRRVPARFFEELTVPLPPIEEQRRIAAVLDAADTLRARRREALAKLDTLTQAIFIDMFADARSAKSAELAEVAEVQGGLQVSAKRKSNPLEVPYLRVANVFRGRIDLTEVKTLRVTPREMDRTVLQKDDLLVVEGHGNKDEIGRVGRWTGEIDPCVHQNHLIRVRCDVGVVLPRYVESFMNSEVGRRALLRAANTTSGLNTISTSDVRSVRLPVPSLARQIEFANRLDRVDAGRGCAATGAARLDDLFVSLQQRAFRGEL